MHTSLNQKVQQHLSTIEKYFLSEYRNHLPSDSMGLLTGLGGIILLQSLFLQTTKNKKFKKEIDTNLELLIETIEKDEYSAYSFCDGLAGIGWLFNYLNERKIIDVDINGFLKEMDEVLETEVEKMIIEKNFDILHGSLGLGLYFLKRGKYEIVEKLISSLAENSEIFQNEIIWKRFDYNHHKKYIYDFGLAHGNISIIYFLGKCYQKNIFPDLSLKLIKGCINFYIINIQDIEQYGSFFPNEILVEKYKVFNTYSYSRLGWCYGDLGVLHTLLLVSMWIGDEINEKKFISFLLESLHRKNLTQTGAKDACFCHGSSGVAHLYLNLYRITKNEALRDTIKYWMKKTVLFGNKTENSLDYLIFNGTTGWEKPPPNLLNGLGGISLSFLSFLYDDLDDNWNEIFFLS